MKRNREKVRKERQREKEEILRGGGAVREREKRESRESKEREEEKEEGRQRRKK